MHSSLLKKIDSAWPLTPYPGDHILSECWCDECEFAVSNLRGKAWNELTRDEFNGEKAYLSWDAFRYYLPALLRFSVDDPGDVWLSGEIMARFVAIQMEPGTDVLNERCERVKTLSSHFSNEQRLALTQYFSEVDKQGWQFPLFTQRAIQCVKDGLVEPVPHDSVMTWTRNRERELQLDAQQSNDLLESRSRKL